MVQPAEIQLFTPADATIAEDVQVVLNDLQRKLYYQRRVEKLVKSIYEELSKPEKWIRREHRLAKTEFTVHEDGTDVKVSALEDNRYQIEWAEGQKCKV